MNQSINTDSKNKKQEQGRDMSILLQKGTHRESLFQQESSTKNQSKKQKSKSVKTVEEEELLSVSINTVKRSDVISVTTKIEGKHLPMELDTGSAISVIPIKTYKELFSH